MKLQDVDFRIYNKSKNTFTYVEIHKLCVQYSNPSQQYGESKSDLHAYSHNKPMCPSDSEIELFTGFYDENGTKIYEGDIIDTGDFRDIVKFEKSQGWILQETLDSLDDYEDWQIKVIGNIHDVL